MTSFALPEVVPVSSTSLVDATLQTKLRTHQLQACDFVLNRLLADSRIPGDNKSTGQDRGFEIPQTGAILADDVGTGKVSNT